MLDAKLLELGLGLIPLAGAGVAVGAEVLQLVEDSLVLLSEHLMIGLRCLQRLPDRRQLVSEAIAILPRHVVIQADLVMLDAKLLELGLGLIPLAGGGVAVGAEVLQLVEDSLVLLTEHLMIGLRCLQRLTQRRQLVSEAIEFQPVCDTFRLEQIIIATKLFEERGDGVPFSPVPSAVFLESAKPVEKPRKHVPDVFGFNLRARKRETVELLIGLRACQRPVRLLNQAVVSAFLIRLSRRPDDV